jgi:hypothetical protein
VSIIRRLTPPYSTEGKAMRRMPAIRRDSECMEIVRNRASAADRVASGGIRGDDSTDTVAQDARASAVVLHVQTAGKMCGVIGERYRMPPKWVV